LDNHFIEQSKGTWYMVMDMVWLIDLINMNECDGGYWVAEQMVSLLFVWV